MAGDLPLEPLPPAPGSPLDVTQIIGRDGDAARAWAQLEHASLRLNEPRRLGKTSLLALMAERPAPGWIVVNQTFQGVGTTADLVDHALSGIARHRTLSARAKDVLKGFASMAKLKGSSPDGMAFELSAAFRDDPVAALVSALEAVDKALGPGERLLLAWDEVPDMVLAIARNESPASAVRALGLLRSFRQAPSRGPSGIRWLLTGSVGFHHMLRDLGDRHDLINDLEPLSLGPLDATSGRELGHRLLLGAGVQPSAEVLDELVALTGRIPFLEHLVAKQVKDRGLERVAPGDCTALLDDAVSDLDKTHQLTSFLTRIGSYYGDHGPAADWLLDALAVEPGSRHDLRVRARGEIDLGSDADLRNVLAWLTEDHYLTRIDEGGAVAYAWRYPPLQRIWEVRRR